MPAFHMVRDARRAAGPGTAKSIESCNFFLAENHQLGKMQEFRHMEAVHLDAQLPVFSQLDSGKGASWKTRE
jgi:hypothetical protein